MIGCYLAYSICSIQTSGYVLYGGYNVSDSIDIRNAVNRYHMQPLIEVTFGKDHTYEPIIVVAVVDMRGVILTFKFSSVEVYLAFY